MTTSQKTACVTKLNNKLIQQLDFTRAYAPVPNQPAVIFDNNKRALQCVLSTHFVKGDEFSKSDFAAHLVTAVRGLIWDTKVTAKEFNNSAAYLRIPYNGKVLMFRSVEQLDNFEENLSMRYNMFRSAFLTRSVDIEEKLIDFVNLCLNIMTYTLIVSDTIGDGYAY